MSCIQSTLLSQVVWWWSYYQENTFQWFWNSSDRFRHVKWFTLNKMWRQKHAMQNCSLLARRQKFTISGVTGRVGDDSARFHRSHWTLTRWWGGILTETEACKSFFGFTQCSDDYDTLLIGKKKRSSILMLHAWLFPSDWHWKSFFYHVPVWN